MGWTAFNAAAPSLVGTLIRSPRASISDLQDRYDRTTSTGERLRLLGMLAAAHHKTGAVEKALALIAEGDGIPRGFARAFAVADFTIYAAAVVAQERDALEAVERVNAALDALVPTLGGAPRTAPGRAALRRRQLAAANLYTTRGNVYVECLSSPDPAARDAVTSLRWCPDSRNLSDATCDMIHRSQLGALSVFALAMADGAAVPRDAQLYLDRTENVWEDAGLIQGLHAAQLSRCRAYVLRRAGKVDAAALLLAEALHWCVEAGARHEFDQTLATLTQLRKGHAAASRRHWCRQWAARWESPVAPARSHR